MKAYTDIEQSKKLAEILPLESADMSWCNNSIKGVNYTGKYSAYLYTIKEMKDSFDKALVGWDKHWKLIPAWSLNALLNILPSSTLDSSDDHHYRLHCMERFTEWHDNAVDACVEMILKLHEQMIADWIR